MGFAIHRNNQRLMSCSPKIRMLQRSQFVTMDRGFLKTHLQGSSIHSSGLKKHATLWEEDQGSAYRSQNVPCWCIMARSVQRMRRPVCAYDLGFRISKPSCRIDDVLIVDLLRCRLKNS